MGLIRGTNLDEREERVKGRERRTGDRWDGFARERGKEKPAARH